MSQPKQVFIRSPQSEPATIPCPFCGEQILAVAKKCKHCGEFFDGSRPISRADSPIVVTTQATAKKWKLQKLLVLILFIIGMVWLIASGAAADRQSPGASPIAWGIVAVAILWGIYVKFAIWWHHK